MRYLITSRAGAGKSTVCETLTARGEDAYDGDTIPGLARWQDALTEEPLEVPDLTNIDSSKIHWSWNRTILTAFLNSTQDKRVFLCGSADNDVTFYDLFDKVFILDVSPEIQAERLRNRTNNPYGKHPDKIKMVIVEQRDLMDQARSLGAIAIDANRPVDVVVDEILSLTP